MSQNQYPYETPRPVTPATPLNPAAPGTTMAPGVAANPAALGVVPDARLQAAFLQQAFLWMFLGLLVTAGVAFFVQSNEKLLSFANSFYFLLLIGQLALVVGITAAIRRISASAALGLFFVYAASLGVTMGLIVSFYTTGSVATAFVSASAMFGAAAVYGAVTKRSLANMGGFLFMALIGLIVAMVVNIFLASSTVTFIISIVGVVIFTALTAYDVQRIQGGALAAATGSMEKGAVIGALTLYLDFINLFLFMLRLLGGRN
jgi:FtsH-binding integral membrane protein